MNAAPNNEADTDLRILLTGEEHVPLYMQIVHQIRYLVTSDELAPGAQLPSVRALARSLDINTGTVAQAYRVLKDEGLIDSQQGRGTYVVPQGTDAGSDPARQIRFAQLMDELVAKAYAMGYDRSEIRRQVATSLQTQVMTFPVVLIAPNASAAHKYAQLVREALTASLLPTIIPGTLEEVQRGDARLLDAYKRAYFTVVAFVTNVSLVQEALTRHGVTSELIGLSAVMNKDTIDALHALGPDRSYALMTEARNVNTALSLLSQHTSLDLNSLQIYTELSSREQISSLTAEKVIHTFGVTDLLIECGIPPERRMQMTFTLSAESYERLKYIAAGSAVPD